MKYNVCGESGLKLPATSLGLWHNFGEETAEKGKRDICHTAFDLGIMHFDLANNYGTLAGWTCHGSFRVLEWNDRHQGELDAELIWDKSRLPMVQRDVASTARTAFTSYLGKSI